MQFFLRKRGNYRCLFHYDNRHKVVADSVNCFTGIPYPPVIKNGSNDGTERQFNILNCGCPVESSLYAFYIWKTIEIRSLNTAIYTTFTMGDKHNQSKKQTWPAVADPRIQAFWAKSLSDVCDLPVFSLYGGFATNSTNHMLKVKYRQLLSLTNSIAEEHGVKISLEVAEGLTIDQQRLFDEVIAEVGISTRAQVNASIRSAAYMQMAQYC